MISAKTGKKQQNNRKSLMTKGSEKNEINIGSIQA